MLNRKFKLQDLVRFLPLKKYLIIPGDDPGLLQSQDALEIHFTQNFRFTKMGVKNGTKFTKTESKIVSTE